MPLVLGRTCAGLFPGGSTVYPTISSLMPDAGVILSSGDVAGPNDSCALSSSFNWGGEDDPDLVQLVPSPIVGRRTQWDRCGHPLAVV